MKYLVMECHTGYAVVLDAAGRFCKVANRHYRVGQTVTDVYLLGPDLRRRAPRRRMHLPAALLAAACLCLMALGAWQLLLAPYGTVRVQINPDIRFTVNRLNQVIRAEGVNPDGTALLAEQHWLFRSIDQAAVDTADLAMAQGYLTEGGEIRLSVDSAHTNWQTTTRDRLVQELEAHTAGRVTITTDADTPDTIVIPVPAPAPSPTAAPTAAPTAVPTAVPTAAPTAPPVNAPDDDDEDNDGNDDDGSDDDDDDDDDDGAPDEG